MKTRRFRKQITYDSDVTASEKLLYLAKVFYIKKAIIKRVGSRWRLIVEWE